MYSNGPASPTNNPFIESSAENRFPDISESSSHISPSALSPQYSLWPTAGSPTGYSFQPQGYSPQGANYSGPISPQQTNQFRPSSSFGQQLVHDVNSGTQHGYLQSQNNQYQGTPQVGAGVYGITPQQQVQNNPGYVPQFDPYASIGQGWEGQNRNQNQNQNQNQNLPLSSGGILHPRDHIRTHKAELEIWDPYAWKQLFNSFDALKDAWEVRKKDIEGRVGQLQTQMHYGGYHPTQIQQEGSRLQMLMKEAELHIDSVAASLFQMREVLAGYRQSADMASKRRVRESCNAALQALPEWPEPY